jgi:uncharacterized protein (DUF58 family)
MTARRPSRGLPVFRCASLLLPPALAWQLARTTLHRSQLDEVLAYVVGPLLLLVIAGLVARIVGACLRRAPVTDAIDILTGTGCGTAWIGAASIAAGVAAGWASLSVVGLFGLGVLTLTVLWTMLWTSGGDPWRRASLTRTFTPGRVEGEPVSERVRLESPRIPLGFRLLISGRVGPRWPGTRYAFDSSASGSDVEVSSDLGPGLRGQHHAEALEVWLQDVLGLTRTARSLAGDALLEVQARAAAVDDFRPRQRGLGHDNEARVRRPPTEGYFHLREYAPGDDVRRIHWLRSLAAQNLVIRLPDEAPPDRLALRLVLDTFHPRLPEWREHGATMPDTLMDAMVAVWLGTGRALVRAGVRVDLVVALADGEVVREPLSERQFSRAQHLATRAAWQRSLAPSALLTETPTAIVSHRLPLDDAESEARWIMVPAHLWAPFFPTGGPLLYSPLRLPFPAGSADNRLSRRKREHLRRFLVRGGEAAFAASTVPSHTLQRGHFVAHPAGPARAKLEVLP